MAHSHDSLEDCVRQAQSGNRRAFEELVKTFEVSVRAWTAAHSPPGIDADEVAQATFITVYERLKDYVPGTHFSAWLFTVARYQLLREVTRSRRLADYQARYALDCLNEELRRRADQPEEEVARQLDYLSTCLEALPENRRRLVSWRYSESISLCEMAERAGCSVAAIKKQLWQVRQKLRACVEVKLSTNPGGSS